MAQMQKGERIISFLTRLQEINDQISVVRSTPSTMMVRLALNAITDDEQVFVQSILRRVTLLGREEIWASL